MSWPSRRAALQVVATGVLLAVPIVAVLASRPTPPPSPARPVAGSGYDDSGMTLTPPRPRPLPPPSATPLASPASPPPATAPPSAAGGPLPAFSHVFTIVMENHEYGSIIGSGAAPYINGLAASYGLATNYYAIAHPSLPNYLALTSGSTYGIRSDCTTCFINATNIADQVEQSGRTWKAYMEDMPSPCYLGGWSGRYALKHDPFLYYLDIRNNFARCAAHVVPFTQFGSDLASGAVPNYVWITPNLCNDMHDCAVGVGDGWLSRVVPPILASPAFRDGGVLFITFDEGWSSAGCCGDSYGGHVATLVVSPMAVHGYRSGVPETHYSLLRTVEDAWQLGELRGASCGCSPPMKEYF